MEIVLEFKDIFMIEKIKDFVKWNLRGIAQIMFQRNATTGLIFLTAIVYCSWHMAIGLLIGTVTGTTLGYLLDTKRGAKGVKKGMYGFNAALMGIIIVFQFGLSWASVGWIVGSAAITSLMMYFAMLKEVRIFTFPFVFLSWIVIYLINSQELLPLVLHPTVDENLLQQPITEMFERFLVFIGMSYQDERLDDVLIFATHGFGQIMFQTSFLASLMFLIGVYVNKPVAALYGMFASILAITISRMIEGTEVIINTGMVSFNAVLCAIAFSGTRHRDGLFVIISTLLTVLLDSLMNKLNIPAYTFPFVLTMWILLFAEKRIRRMSNMFTTDVD